MGETAETMTKKRKKKGRPSLIELQKRSLKQQQLQQQSQSQSKHQNPNSLPAPARRSTRRNSNSYAPEWIGGDDDDDEDDNGPIDEDDDDDERKQKKHKLLLGLNSQQQRNNNRSSANSSGLNSYGSNSNAEGDGVGDTPESASSKRHKISAVRLGSDDLGEKVAKATDTLHESSVEPGPTTPLPDKKLLVFILDRLQKKDTYGVFSDPVDPEELPDYHDIIEHPMDFSTLRKKLDGGVYADLEQFEKDVFLICSNAMQYNSPDTIYFRQARSMQELAKKDFEDLRQDSDDSEPQPKVVKTARRGRPPGKMKKNIEKSPLDRVNPEFSSDATLATGADNNNLPNGYNLRRTTSYKYQPADSSVRASYGSHNNDSYSTWLSEWENEFPASVLRAVLKYGKKPFIIDENKRESYNNSLDLMHEPSVLTTFEGEMKQLMPVGLSAEHGYARSLARFAADMGPLVWKIASKKIESVLPPGVQFGPGWVGENTAVERQQIIFSDKQKFSNNSLLDDHFSRLQPSTNNGTNSTSSRQKEDMVETIGSHSASSSLDCGIKPMAPLQQQPTMGMARFGMTSGKTYSEHPAMPSQLRGMVSISSNTFRPVPANEFNPTKGNLCENTSAFGSSIDSQALPNAGHGKLPWQGLTLPRQQQDFHPFPPDLNVGFLGPGSPGPVPIGSPQQPDLALQL